MGDLRDWNGKRVTLTQLFQLEIATTQVLARDADRGPSMIGDNLRQAKFRVSVYLPLDALPLLAQKHALVCATVATLAERTTKFASLFASARKTPTPSERPACSDPVGAAFVGSAIAICQLTKTQGNAFQEHFLLV
jgi:hypothetical protein